MPDLEKIYTVSSSLGDGGLECDSAATDGTDLFLLLRGTDNGEQKIYKYDISADTLTLWLELDDYETQSIYDIAYFDRYLYVAYKDGDTVKLGLMTRPDIVTDQLTLIDLSGILYDPQITGVHFGQTDSFLRLSGCYDTSGELTYAIATVYNLGGNIWTGFGVSTEGITQIIRTGYIADRDLFRVAFGGVESIYEFEGVSSFTEIIATNPHAPAIFTQVSQRDEDRLLADTKTYYSDNEWVALSGEVTPLYQPVFKSCDYDYLIYYEETTNIYKLGAASTVLDGTILDPPDSPGSEIVIRTDDYTYLLGKALYAPGEYTIAIWRRGKDGDYYESKGGLPGLNE